MNIAFIISIFTQVNWKKIFWLKSMNTITLKTIAYYFLLFKLESHC